MSEASKDLVRRFYREAIVERDASACERLLSEDFVHDGLIAEAWDEMDTGAIAVQQ